MQELHQPSSNERTIAIEWIEELSDAYLGVNFESQEEDKNLLFKATFSFWLHQFAVWIYDYIQLLKNNFQFELVRQYISSEEKFRMVAYLSFSLAIYYMKQEANLKKYYYFLPDWEELLKQTNISEKEKQEWNQCYQVLLEKIPIPLQLVISPSIILAHYFSKYNHEETIIKFSFLLSSLYCKSYIVCNTKLPIRSRLIFIAASTLATARHLMLKLDRPEEIWDDTLKSIAELSWDEIQPHYSCLVELGKPLAEDFHKRREIMRCYNLDTYQASAWRRNMIQLAIWFFQVVPAIYDVLKVDNVIHITALLTDLRDAKASSLMIKIVFKMCKQFLLIDIRKQKTNSANDENISSEQIEKIKDMSSLKLLLASKLGLFSEDRNIDAMDESNQDDDNFLRRHYKRISHFA